ncbi:MAG: YbjN domain-containing protein [Lachnospiraceae bacterium]|nr:YbjN domain-containing protein [Lachnospiraceae bacterium]
MASQAAELFMAYMESQDMKIHLIDEEHNLLRAGLGLENTQLVVYFQFDPDDTSAHIEGREFAQIPKDQVEKVYKICNSLNDSYRWVKFVWDEEAQDLCCRVDAVLQLDSCAQEMYELMARTAGIVDDAYPKIMKALWA